MTKTMSPGGLTTESVDISKPFLYHQPALSFVFSGPLSTRRLPTQLVFPNGRVAIGTTPNGVGWTESREGEVEDDEARINRLRSDTVIAFACLHESQSFETPLKNISLLILLFIAFQTLWIAVALSGGQILPFGRRSYNTGLDDVSTGSSLQRAIYTNILVLHLLPLIGVLYRLPVALTIYNVMQFVNFVLTFTCCLYSALDALVLATIIPIQILAGKIETLMESP